MEMKKYMTRGVQECIPFDLVVLMWQMYDRCKEDMDPCDYLHVFQLKRGYVESRNYSPTGSPRI